MSVMPMRCFANALISGRPKDAISTKTSGPRISPVFFIRPSLRASSEPGLVEGVCDVKADDVLAVGELRDRIRTSGAIDLPRAVLGEGIPLPRLVVAVFDLTVQMLGEQIFTCHRGLVEGAADARPRAAVVLEPLATDGARDTVREGVVRDGRETLPERRLAARRRSVLVAPVVVEQQGQCGGRFDGRDEVGDAAFVAGLVRLLGPPDAVSGECDLVAQRIGDVADAGPPL